MGLGCVLVEYWKAVKPKNIELAKTPAGSLELAGVLMFTELVGKKHFSVQTLWFSVSRWWHCYRKHTPQRYGDRTEDHRDEFSDRFLNASLQPYHPLTQLVRIKLSFTRRSYIFLRTTAIPRWCRSLQLT